MFNNTPLDTKSLTSKTTQNMQNANANEQPHIWKRLLYTKVQTDGETLNFKNESTDLKHLIDMQHI